MKRTAVFLLLAALWTAACDDAPQEGQPQEETAGGGGGGGAGSGGGGGQVKVGAGQSSRETIAERYEQALDLIRKRDWDGAHAQLLDALARSRGTPIEKDIRQHLAVVERGILAQPAYNVDDVFSQAEALYDKKVSIRGYFIPGGDVGRVTYYFWVQTGATRIQARYPQLGLEDKRTILQLKEGAQVLVRGTLKSPWGTNPNPYLELNYFRLERLPPEEPAYAEGED